MRRKSLAEHKKQQGSALVVAIFVIVVLGLLVSVLTRLVSTSSDSTVVEVLGNRAFMAAQSGLQRAMLSLYPVGGEFEACVNGEIIDNGYDSEDIGIPGEQCTAEVICTTYNQPDDPGYDESKAMHFRLESTGECVTGGTTTSRTIAIETRVNN